MNSAQSNPPCTHNVALWKLVWNMPNVPKINFFIWTIMHQKLLPGENLIKRGFFGPYRCCFCQQSKESTTHILVECVFAQKVWALVLRGLPISFFFPLFAEPVTLFKIGNQGILVLSLPVMFREKSSKPFQNSFGRKFGWLEMISYSTAKC